MHAMQDESQDVLGAHRPRRTQAGRRAPHCIGDASDDSLVRWLRDGQAGADCFVDQRKDQGHSVPTLQRGHLHSKSTVLS